MNVRHLEVFHAVMRAGSVTGAAHALNVTQPAVSNVLRHAEQQIGFKLFERAAGRLRPTPEALDLFPDVEEIFGRIETLSRALEEVRDGRSGRIAIAASPTFVNAFLPPAVAAFSAHSPAVRIVVHALPTARTIEERVARREVDLGLVYAPVTDAGTSVIEIFRSDLLCAVPATSDLATQEIVRPSDLVSRTIIGTSNGSRIKGAIDETSARTGIRLPAAAIEVNSLQAACLMVANGVGVALVDSATRFQHRGTDVRFLKFNPTIPVSMCLIFPSNRPRSRLSTQFAECLQSILTTVET